MVGVLPTLLPNESGGDKVAESAGEAIGSSVGEGSWGLAKRMWGKLRPGLEERPGGIEAAKEAANAPGDDDAQAALRLAVKGVLEQDEDLSTVRRLLGGSAARAALVGPLDGRVGRPGERVPAEPDRPGRLQYRPQGRSQLAGLHLDRPAAAPQLDGLTRTIFDDPVAPNRAKHFDQIAWFHDGEASKLELDYSGQAGRFDFVPVVLSGMSTTELSWRLSDHYPLWAEFRMRPR
jgi:hypothetical protein